MHPARIVWSGLVIALALAAVGALAAGSATAQEQPPTIASELAAAQKAVEAKNYLAAAPRFCRILELAAKAKPDQLTGKDWFAVGWAHYYLMGDAFEKAIAGGLTPEEIEQARVWRDNVRGLEPEPLVKVLSKGQQVNIADYIVKGKTTIFDFYSEFCPPCTRISPLLEKLAEQRQQDIAVVKVDINRPGVQGIDWDSPVARQYGLNSIPHFKIFGPDGRLQAEGQPAYQQVIQLVTPLM
jgi:thiol-disulfide isomerase/thioredoxin